MEVDIDELLINIELRQMSRYLGMVKRSLSNELQKLDETYRLEIEQDVETFEEADEVEHHYQDQFAELETSFPTMIFGSFVVAWYSFVEQKLLDICERRELRLSISAKENGNFGKGIWRAKKIFDANGYKISNNHWQELVKINRLRNFIVHTGYNVPPKQDVEFDLVNDSNLWERDISDYSISEDLAVYLKNHSMITAVHFLRYITPTIEYCEHLVDFGEDFFENLFLCLNNGNSS